jgi:hypothetical protein
MVPERADPAFSSRPSVIVEVAMPSLPPLELDMTRALDEAQREYLRTMVDYNEAQFRLQRALGWPIR